MTTQITMPRLTDQMEEGTIVKWLVADGAPFAVGDDLVEIEADKATITYQAEAAGTLQIVEPEGAVVPVGGVIASMAPRTASRRSQPASNGQPGDRAVTDDRDEGSPAATTVSGGAADARDRLPAPTPLARRIAAENGVDVSVLEGTGPRGRVTRSDVLEALGMAPTAPAEATPARDGGSGRRDVTVRKPSRVQAVVARRMVESKSTIPHFQVATEVTMDAAVRFRERLKAVTDDGREPSINDLFLRASALALRRHPMVNAAYVDGHFELHERVDIGVAVAAEDGLVVVTVQEADVKSLGEIARTSRRLAEKAREKALTPAETSGATFTVSNLGMFGVTAITPVIDPQQAAILGVGAMRPVLARCGGEIVERMIVTCTLSCDHRILDGAQAAAFLSDIRANLEEPMRLAL